MWNPLIDGPLTILFLTIIGAPVAFAAYVGRMIRDIGSLD